MGSVGYLAVAVALVCILQPSLQGEPKEAAVKLVKHCQQTTGATDADIEALRQSKTPETKEGVCMFWCFFEQSKVIQDGKISKDGLIAALTPLMKGDETKIEKLKGMAEACTDESKDATGDKCEIGQKLMHCTVVKGKEFGFEYPLNF